MPSVINLSLIIEIVIFTLLQKLNERERETEISFFFIEIPKDKLITTVRDEL